MYKITHRNATDDASPPFLSCFLYLSWTTLSKLHEGGSTSMKLVLHLVDTCVGVLLHYLVLKMLRNVVSLITQKSISCTFFSNNMLAN